MLPNGASAFELCLRQSTSRVPGQFEPPTIRRTTDAVKPRWRAPNNLPLVNQPACLHDDSAWIYFGLGTREQPDQTLEMAETNGWHALLIRFQAGHEAPALVPLRFEYDSRKLSEGLRGRGWESPRSAQLTWTPQGLVVAPAELPGFYIIPTADLESLLKQSNIPASPRAVGAGSNPFHQAP